MRMFLVVALLLVVACTPSTPEPVQQDVSEQSMPSAPVPVSTGAVAESPDAYRDLQTQDDTFDAMDKALNALG